MFPYAILFVFLSVYIGINYYIGLRTWQWLVTVLPRRISRPAYWSAVCLLALAFPLSRLTPGWLPLWVGEGLAHIGAYWMATYVYVLPLLLLIDLGRLLGRGAGLAPARPADGLRLARATGAAVCLLLVGLVLYGTWAARTTVVTEYALSIPKAAGPYQQLHVVLVSDTHLGSLIGNGRIRQLVRQVNSLEPDLVLLAGDIIDDDFRPFLAHDMAAELRHLRAPLGVYGVLGNHDDGAEDLPAFRAALADAGVRLLVDEWVEVDGSFYVAGRSDGSHRSAPLEQVLAGVDPSRPILLMDHQPDRLDEAVAAGVDLQVSGHTHRGQVWPGRLITDRVFEVDWGYLRKGSTQFVVSQGWGTWGPPIRIGSRSEIASIHIAFGE